MLAIALFALALCQQPAATDEAVKTAAPPSATPLADYAKVLEERKKAEAAKKPATISWEFDASAPPPQPKPPTEEEKRAAANAAAMRRAEQAAKDANAPPGGWPDEGKMRCKPTDSGFVCGNSDKALAPDSPSRQALDEVMKPN
ncbi:MAG: hypothetical protein JWR84_1671 [Caulobacter sp.]|nr:hypothetical protein [Caulobacter sp.]